MYFVQLINGKVFMTVPMSLMMTKARHSFNCYCLFVMTMTRLTQTSSHADNMMKQHILLFLFCSGTIIHIVLTEYNVKGILKVQFNYTYCHCNGFIKFPYGKHKSLEFLR